MERWSVGSFNQIDWQWPREVIKPLSTVLRRRFEVVNRKDHDFASLQLATLHFDGELEPRELRGKVEFKGKLFFAHAGDVTYSKIDVRNGAIGIVPDTMPRVAVSAEYPVYQVDAKLALPDYIKLVFRTRAFRDRINAMISGASGRKRVQPDMLEKLEAPLPPLTEQRAIVERWRSAQAQIAAASVRVEKLKTASAARLLTDLGLTPATIGEMPKSFAVRWADLATWSGSTAFKRLTVGDVHAGKFPVAHGHGFLTDVCHGCSAPPSPVPTALEILKISAVTRGEFMPTEKKFAADNPRVREQFDLRKGDVLLCRTNGTLAYVGMSALVTADQQNLIFPDKVIRVRVKPELIRPDYLWLVLQTPFLRAKIEAAARTAVGNYAIGGKDIWNFEVPLPSLEVQRKLVERVTAARLEIARERAAAAALRQTIAAEVESLILGTQ